VAASAYIDLVADPSGRLTTADIEAVFSKLASRLGRDRIGKRLYAMCFPKVGCGPPTLSPTG
jgi:hypothetical protein